MAIGEILVVILGLCLFEVISSVDNAIINAHVLTTLPEKFKKLGVVKWEKEFMPHDEGLHG